MFENASPEMLIERIKAQDQAALSELYRRFGGAVYNLALNILKDSAIAEEITQDTFLKVWHQSSKYEATLGSVATWLLTITRYTAIDRLRKEQRRSTWNSIDIDEMFDLMGKRGPGSSTAWYDKRILHDLIRQLPPEQIEVIELAFFKGMSHSEMSDHLDVPLGTIKSRVRMGLQKLKALWIQANPSD